MSLSSSATAAANPWLLVLESLEKKINKHSYDTWLKPTRFSHAKGKVLFISVPNAEFKLIGEKYADLISEALENLNLDYSDVEFVTEEAPVNVRHDGGFGPQSSHGTGRGNSSAAAAPGKQARFDWDSAAQLTQKYKFGDFVMGAAISSRTPPRRPWLSAPPRPTTRSSCTAAWAWARRTSCRPLDTR